MNCLFGLANQDNVAALQASASQMASNQKQMCERFVEQASIGWESQEKNLQYCIAIEKNIALQVAHEALRSESCAREAAMQAAYDRQQVKLEQLKSTLDKESLKIEPDATGKTGKALLLMRESFDKGASHAMKARLISKEFRKTCKEQFKCYDEKGNGTIDARVFGQAIHALSAEVDLGDGLLRFHDFVILMQWLELQLELQWLEWQWMHKGKKKASQRGCKFPLAPISPRGVHIEVTSTGPKGSKGGSRRSRLAKRKRMRKRKRKLKLKRMRKAEAEAEAEAHIVE